jgi:hypothetical protein
MGQMPHQAALQVARSVFVYVVFLRQFVDHADQFWQKFLSFPTICEIAEIFDRCTGRFFVVPVPETTYCQLTHALFG